MGAGADAGGWYGWLNPAWGRGAKGLAWDGGAACGEVMVALHWGHGPVTPAISKGTVSGMPQDWQLKWMTPDAGFM